MAIQSLAEAKLALEKEESQIQDSPKDEETIEGGEETVVGDDTPAGDDPPAGDDSIPGDDTVEGDDWTKGDEAPDAAALSNSQAAAIRKKYEAKAKEAKEKATKLEEEVAELKKRLDTPAPVSIKTKPVREQFKNDAEFQEALTKHIITEQQAQFDSAQKAQQAKAARDEALAKIVASTDAHYARAAALAAKSNISPDAYKAADLAVRQAFESIKPEQGDALVDGLIHILGSGSERVFYKLGVNSAKRAEATKLLAEDSSGLRLVAFLSKLNAELAAPIKRETKAPDPAPRIQGDKSNTSGGAKQKRDYDDAMSKGNSQKAWNIRQAAKKAGVDTGVW